jgi:uncharacterized protein YbjT (DUF2867 family)
VVPRLAAAGHNVLVGTRAQRSGHEESEVVFRHDRPASIDEAVTHTEVVVHLASDPTAPTADITMMRRLVTSAAQAGVRHLLYVSIVGIDDHPFPYYRAKAACERALRASDLPWTILRTTQFHGLPGRLAGQLGVGPIGIAPAGVPIQPVDPETVADQVAALVEQGPSGRAPDLGGPEQFALRDAMHRSLRAVGRRRWLMPIRLPARFGGLAFRRGDLLLRPGGVVTGRTFQEYLNAEVARKDPAASRSREDGLTAPRPGD